jgi:hypothetical protein
MANLKRLDVTEFDFDDIKDNLKTFLRGQTEFTDYDFEGSGMNILLDVLAYNTHYLGFNANMLANEMFLDSASLRSSVVSHAKTLGYEPTSVTAPTATLDVTLSDVSNSTRTIPKQTTFSATVNNDSFQFVTIADTTMTKNGNDIVFNDLVVYEGTFVTQRYTVDSTDADQRFVINDNRIDLRTLSVSVQNSSSDTTTTIFTKATDVTQLNSESLVYWLQEVESGKYQVYFGDGVVSKSISNANIVLLEFVATNKELANGASAFTSTAAIDGETSIIVTTVESAKGGGERETINSIKLNAPLDYASQGRCVTVGDYQLYARKLFPQTKSVQVFGGEDGSFDSSLGVVSTQEFGKVFVSIKSITGNNLTVTQKEQLVTDLKKYNVASITPVIIDPQTTYLILGVRFKFNSSLTTKDRSTLETNVNDVLVSYNKNTLTDFNKMFRHSELSGLIDEIDNSILNNITNVSMGQFIEPTLNVSTGYNLYFNNAFDHPVAGHNAVNGGVVASTGFRVSGDTVNKQFYDDDGNGNLRRYYLIGNTRTYVDNAAGTVDYTGGSIKVNSLIITTIEDVDGAASSKVRFTAVPSSKDIVAVRNQVLDIDFTNTSIIGEVDTVAVGTPGAAANYVSYASTPETDSF